MRELLYVGPATERKLHSSAIVTIGDIACASDDLMRRRLGKVGLQLKTFACGYDITPVRSYDDSRGDVDRLVKSYGNGLTCPHDITCGRDARALVWMLAESVAQRLREGRARARTVSVAVRSADDLLCRGCQTTLPEPTDITMEVARVAWALLSTFQTFDDEHPVRGLHVRASNLVSADDAAKLLLFDPQPARTRAQHLDAAVDDLRRRFGNRCVVRGAELADQALANVDIKAENIVHPESFFH